MRISRSRLLATLVIPVALATSITCSDSRLTAPRPRSGPAALAFKPVFSAPALRALASFRDAVDPAYDSVRIVITRTITDTLADTTVGVTPGQPEFTVPVTVVASPGEPLTVDLTYFFNGSPPNFTGAGAVTAAVAGDPQTVVADVKVDFVGPGAKATSVFVTTNASTATFPQTVQATAVVMGSGGAPVPGALLRWTTDNPDVATVDGTGVVQPKPNGGTVQVSATTLDSLATGSATITFYPAAASIVPISGNAQSGEVGLTLPSPLVVEVRSAAGAPIPNQPVTFASSGTGSVSPTTATTDASGRAQTTITLGSTPGNYSITATSGAATSPTPLTATAVPAPASAIVPLSGDLQSDTVGKAVKNPLLVKVTDRLGNPKSGVTVNWTRVGVGTLSSASTTTGTDGQTSVTYTFGSRSGAEIITAAVPGIAPPVTFNLTALASAPNAVTIVSGEAQSLAVGTLAANPLIISVQDGSGNPVAGAPVVWTVASGTATLENAQTSTTTDGRATAQLRAGSTPGPVTVNVAVGAKSTIFHATVTAGPAAKVVFLVQPTAVLAGAPITPAVSVVVRDANNNAVADGTQVTLTIAGGSVGSVLAGTTTKASTADGSAVFSNLSVNLPGTAYTLVASGTGLTGATSNPFNVTASAAGAPTVLAFGVQPGNTVAGAPITPAPTVRILDANNNLVTTATNSVTVALTGGLGAEGPGLAGTATVTAVNGVATFPGLSVSTPAVSYKLLATSGTLTSTNSGVFNVTAAGGGAVASTTVTPTPDSLFSLTQTYQLTATGRNAGNVVVAGTFNWVSRDPSVVTVNASGLLTSVANGVTYVVATEVGGTKDSAKVVVQQRVASVNVTPGVRNIYLTRNFTFTAAAVDGQGNPVSGANTFTWTSVNPAVATVNSSGLVNAVTLGSAQIRATTGTITGIANVSIITPITRIEVGREAVGGVPVADATPLTALGIGRAFTAIAHDTLDAPMPGVVFTWLSTNSSVALLDTVAPTRTHALAAANGVTAITATAQGVSGSATLTVQQVLAGVTITPPSATVAPLGTVQLVARGTDSNNRFISGGTFTFASATPGVATVNASGVVAGVSVGTSDITATSGAITSTAATITVSNSVPPVISFGRDTLSVGRSGSVSIPIFLSRPNATPVTVNLAARDTNAFFSVSSVTIPANTASINVTLNGRNAGTTAVFATDGGGSGYAGDTAVVAVTARIQFAQTGWSVNSGDQVTTQVLLSDPSPVGGTFVTFSYGTAGRAQVSPDPAFIPAGQLAADVIISGLSSGSTTITPVATGVNGTAATLSISVARLLLTGTTLRLGAGQSGQNLEVYVQNTSNVNIPITITTTDNSIVTPAASVSIPAGSNYSYYTINALQPGTARIILSAPGWIADTLNVTVTVPSLKIFGGGTINSTAPQSTVTVYTEDDQGNVHPRTNSLVLQVTSSDTSVMVVLDSVPSVAAGLYYNNAIRVRPGGSAGQAWIKVSAGGQVSDSIKYTVVGPQLSFSPNTDRIGAGQSEPSVFVQASNNVTQPLTITLSNTNPTSTSLPATVTIPVGSNGISFGVTGLAPGSSTISATAPGYGTGTSTFVVTTPAVRLCCNSTIDNFSTNSLTVYSVDSTRNIHVRATPLTVSFVSLDPSILTVDSSAVSIPANQYYNNNAQVTAVGVGTARLVATAPGHTPDTLTYTVQPPKLSFSFFTTTYGRRQESGSTDLYATIPGNRTVPITVTFTQKQPGVDSLATTLTIPAGQNYQYFKAFGRAFGKDTIIASAPGYVPDTAFITVTTPKLVAAGLPSTATTTNAPTFVTVYAEDSTNITHYVSDTLVVKVESSDSNVVRPTQPYFRILKGNYFNNTNAIAFVGPGTATLTFSDSAGTGYLPYTTNPITVTGPALIFNSSTLKYGMRQMSSPNEVYVYTANSVATPLVVNLLSTDPRVVGVPETVTIPAGQNYAYFSVTGNDTLGTIQVQGSAVGYSPPTPITVQVTVPKFVISTASSLNTTSVPQIITVYAADNTGNIHYTTEDVVVTLLSSAPGVASIDSTFVTIQSGRYYTQAARWAPVSPGTAQLSASDPRPVFYQYGTGTANVAVVTPNLNLSWGTTTLGIGQYINEYVYTPDAQSQPLTIALSHVGPARTSAPATVTIPAGSNIVFFQVTGTAVGTDTLTATVVSGVAHNPATGFTAVDLGRVDPLSNFPTSLAVGDSVQVTMFSRDANQSSRVELATTTFTLTPNANIQFVSGGSSSSVVTSADIPADQAFTRFWVKGVSAGTGSVTITSANYQSFTMTLTVTP